MGQNRYGAEGFSGEGSGFANGLIKMKTHMQQCTDWTGQR